MNRKTTAAGALVALLLLASCGSTSDILGGMGGSSNGRVAELRGTVDYVDTNARWITLTNVTGGTQSMLSSAGSNTVRVYYDENTEVTYNGRTYRPMDLERGDQVSVRAEEQGNTLLARDMQVTYNAGGMSSGSSGSSTSPYTTSIRGTVRYVDSNRRTIEVDRYGSSTVFVEFDSSTPVTYSGQRYNVMDLERGDEVDIRVRDLGNGRYVASDVSVIRSVSSTSGSGSVGSSTSQQGTIRGTVRYVNTSNRTIELEQTSWSNNFIPGSGSNTGSTMIIQYDANTRIDYQGGLHPISGLERGDVIEVRVQNLGGSRYATTQNIWLIRNVRQ
jgi:hypothetical protein